MDKRKKTQDMEEIYNTYFSPVYNYVYYKLLNRERTEDIVSQVFMKVLAHLDSFDESKASMKTWIFRIAERTLIDYYRKLKPTVSYDQEESGLDSVLSVHFDEQYEQAFSPLRQTVLEALRQLPERERTFVYYKYYLNITNREIAHRMNMNENTVSGILARARQKLRAVLQDEL